MVARLGSRPRSFLSVGLLTLACIGQKLVVLCAALQAQINCGRCHEAMAVTTYTRGVQYRPSLCSQCSSVPEGIDYPQSHVSRSEFATNAKA